MIALALGREVSRIHDDLLVVDRGRYLGTVSMRTLMTHHKDLLRASMSELADLDRKNRARTVDLGPRAGHGLQRVRVAATHGLQAGLLARLPGGSE